MRIMHGIVCDVQDGCSSFLSGQVDQARLQHADDDNADADDDDAVGGILLFSKTGLIHISKERCLAKRYLCTILLCNKDLFNLEETN